MVLFSNSVERGIYCICDIFLIWDYSFDSFPSIFNVIAIIFQNILYDQFPYFVSLM